MLNLNESESLEINLMFSAPFEGYDFIKENERLSKPEPKANWDGWPYSAEFDVNGDC